MISSFKTVLVVGLLLSISIISYSAGFDCKKASTWVEKSICNNSELSKIDDKVNTYYRQKLTKYPNNAKYNKEEQHQWLQFQRDSCKSVACLKREYQEYIANEKGVGLKFSDLVTNNTSLPQPYQFGRFQDEFDISIYQGEKDGWQATKATEIIDLHKVNNRPNIAVLNANLIFTNGHECYIGDEVVHWSENHWKMRDDGLQCELRLYPYHGKVLLKDINNECRKSMCGARGYFDGLLLQKKIDK